MALIFKKTFQASLRMFKKFPKLSHFNRSLITTSQLTDNYEGDGKTTVTILNREYKNLIMIDTYNSLGFRLNNGIFAIGPLAVFPRTILQWNIKSVEDITPESFSLFCLLDPKLDILILGTGDYRVFPEKYVLEYLKSKKITTEILPTQQACSTFNFLNAEGRYVAGAFIPPTSLVMYEEELKILEIAEGVDQFSSKLKSSEKPME